MLEEKTAQNAIKTKLQQERHREERRQLLLQTSEAPKFAQMSDFEKQLRVTTTRLINRETLFNQFDLGDRSSIRFFRRIFRRIF